VTTLLDLPVRVDGVQLIGEMSGSGYRTPPALVRRADGQVLQLTPLLYLVLQACDGQRGHEDVAQVVGHALGRSVSGDDVRTLVDTHLRPLGLLRAADGSEPELKRTDPLIGLKPRFAVTDPRTTRRLTDPFRVLFRPLVPLAVVAGFAAIVAWVFFERGLGASAYEAFERPQLLLLVFVVSVISGGLHEFGHAAAARYGGADPGSMGAGLYIVWPAFYTDVTDSYRLDRAGRLRTDLGGLYFNAIVVVLTYVWWWATGWEALLLLVATQVLQMGQQLLPLLRFDGYHVLADLAGVPDLYQRIRPTLVGLLPNHWNSPENAVLTRRARVVITLWVLVTVPLMALMFLAMIRAVPRLLGTARAVMAEDAASVSQAARDGQLLDAAGYALQLLGVVLPVLATAVILGRLAVRWFGGLAVWSRGSVGRRGVAAALSAVLITGLAWAWWPQPGTYRPIDPQEPGTLNALLSSAPAAPASAAADSVATLARPALPVGEAARRRLDGDTPLVAAFAADSALPTKDEPVLSLVLVPNDDTRDLPTSSPSPTSSDPTSGPSSSPSSSPGSTPGPEPTSGASPGTTPEDDAWVFPFDQPLAPEEGDNQALAVNTEDGTVTYDVAFALVWAEDDEVLNVNEAHAYASCTDCVAVAVAFQVVLIMDDAQVVVPQNLAVAANYDCHSCITAAVASQLVLSIPDEPGEEQLLQLVAVWERLLEFARTITAYSLTEITDRLDGFKEEITQILGAAPPATVTPSPSSSPESPTQSPATLPTPTEQSTTPATSPEPSPTQSPVQSPTPSPTDSPSTSPTSPASPSPAPTDSPSTSPSPEPTDSPSTSPSQSPTPSGTTSPSPSPTVSPTGVSPTQEASERDGTP
jgi:putative peptide zinc metalloprotease protein